MMAKFYCFVACVCFATFLPAQSTDSLRQQFDKYPMVATFQAGDTALLEMALVLTRQYNAQYELDAAVLISDRALKTIAGWRNSTPLPPVVAPYEMQLYFQKAGALLRSSEYVSALESFQQAQLLAEKTGNQNMLAEVYVGIARCHQSLEDYNLALSYARKAGEVLEKHPNNTTLAKSYIPIADYYGHVSEKTDSAIYFARRAVQLLEAEGNYPLMCRVTFSLLEFFAYDFQTDSCLHYLAKIKPFVEEVGTPDLLLRYNISMGKSLYEKGRNREALVYLKAARDSVEQEENPQIIHNAFKYLMLGLAAAGQPIEALKAQEIALAAYGEDINNDKARALNSAQLNFEFEKKAAASRLELERQKRIRDISIGGGIAVLLLSLLVWMLYRQAKKSARVLAQKNAEIERSYRELKETQDQLVLTEKQREAQSVRVRIARDIHDELGAGLTRITMISDVLRRKLRLADTDTAEMLDRIVANSRGVSASLGEIVWAVNPTHDSPESLALYLKHYAAQFLDGMGMEANFDFPKQAPVGNLDPDLKRNIFLVMKEALNNAVKYSKATTISIALEMDNERFRLTIRDNGIGFQPGQLSPTGGGNGLLNMVARMETLGCACTIDSAPGMGCTVSAHGKWIQRT